MITNKHSIGKLLMEQELHSAEDEEITDQIVCFKVNRKNRLKLRLKIDQILKEHSQFSI